MFSVRPIKDLLDVLLVEEIDVYSGSNKRVEGAIKTENEAYFLYAIVLKCSRLMQETVLH